MMYITCIISFPRYKEVWDYNYCHDESNFKRPGHESKAIGHFTQVQNLEMTREDLEIGIEI